MLWAGVPLITRRGETFASRVASSLLATAGCGDWIFDDERAAFDATLALARSPAALQAARARVEHARAASPLFDAAAYARDFEALLGLASSSPG
jgi:predicted O-linked N-acetylglucosamine transferase (SPINDLY family)